MIRDLVLASAATMLCAIVWIELSMTYFMPEHDFVALAGVMASIALGALILWRQRIRPLIPVVAIYCVVMAVIVAFIAFQLAWRRGLVEL